MKIKIDIKSTFGNVLFSFEKENNTIKDTLEEANLRGADLRGANLGSANLRGADLRGANLRGADLGGAYLEDAYLESADLGGANLRGADLEGANYSEYTSFLLLQCPIEGSFIGWKKCDGYIVKLKICEDAERSSSTSLKCRCSKAEVLEIQNIDGSIADITEICSNHDKNFIYKVGETVEVKDFDKCRWNECSNGIHFFIDRNMAVAYRK
jgi:uncharacterized protein YjbI with pentapeptide repeats